MRFLMIIALRNAKSGGERILKIDQHLPELWARIKVGVFSEHNVYCVSYVFVGTNVTGCCDVDDDVCVIQSTSLADMTVVCLRTETST